MSLYVCDWVRVKKNSNSWFVSDNLNVAEKTMVISADQKYRRIIVAHLIGMYLPMDDFELVERVDTDFTKKFRNENKENLF